MSKRDLAATDRGDGEPGRATVTSLRPSRRGSVVRASGPRGSTVVTLAAVPDREGARRRLRSTRHIDGVDLVIGPDGARAEVRARRHRLPSIAPISIAVALGLVELGIRATVIRAV